VAPLHTKAFCPGSGCSWVKYSCCNASSAVMRCSGSYSSMRDSRSSAAAVGRNTAAGSAPPALSAADERCCCDSDWACSTLCRWSARRGAPHSGRFVRMFSVVWLVGGVGVEGTTGFVVQEQVVPGGVPHMWRVRLAAGQTTLRPWTPQRPTPNAPVLSCQWCRCSSSGHAFVDGCPSTLKILST